MSLIKLLGISIHITIQNNNTILKTLLYDYAKTKLTQKQLYILYCYIASIQHKHKDTELYKILDNWISNNSNTIIKQFLKL
jgi:hypothetical protein